MWVSDPSASSTGCPYAATKRPAWVLAALVDTCCPRTARTASSASSTVRGMRCQARLGHDRAQLGIAAQGFVHRFGVRIEVQQPPAAGDRRCQVAEIVEDEDAAHMVGGRVQGHDGVAERKAQAASVCAAADLLATGNDAGREVAEDSW